MSYATERERTQDFCANEFRNGYPEPTFRVPDLENPPRTILFSSFSLQPIPINQLPRGVEYQLGPVPTDQIEGRLAEIADGQAIPADVLANPLLNDLMANVQSQNPQQRTRPTALQLLRELRRQNALTAFQAQHEQLLRELGTHIENGGSIFASFASNPELQELYDQIIDYLGVKYVRVSAAHIQAELDSRIREGLGANATDHQIHQLQHLLSQLLRQLRREAAGQFRIPYELNQDPVYLNIQNVFLSKGLMPTHQAMADDIRRRIPKMRQEKNRQQREGSVAQSIQSNEGQSVQQDLSQLNQISSSQSRQSVEHQYMHTTVGQSTHAVFNQSESIANTASSVDSGSVPRARTKKTWRSQPRKKHYVPEPTPDRVIQYNMDPNSKAGLPVGFALDPKWTKSSREALRYYVNDGPRGLQETENHYKSRTIRAVDNMGIEHRIRPYLTPEDFERLAGDKKGTEKARAELRSNNKKAATEHFAKLNLVDRFCRYGQHYDKRWRAEKRARQARNAVKRREAQDWLRVELQNRYGMTNMRLPTPPPPDDSGDE